MMENLIILIVPNKIFVSNKIHWIDNSLMIVIFDYRDIELKDINKIYRIYLLLTSENVSKHRLKQKHKQLHQL